MFPKLLVQSSLSSLLLIPYHVFFIIVIVFFISDCCFYMVFISLCKYSLSSSLFLPSSLSTLITIVLNTASGRLLTSILFSSFSWNLPYSFIWDMFLCLFILTASLCLFLSIISAMSHSLGRVALCSRCPVGLQVCLMCRLYVPSCCSWALIAVGTSVSGIDPQADWLLGLSMTIANGLLFRVWLHRVEFALPGLLCLLCPPFGSVICGACWVVF